MNQWTLLALADELEKIAAFANAMLPPASQTATAIGRMAQPLVPRVPMAHTLAHPVEHTIQRLAGHNAAGAAQNAVATVPPKRLAAAAAPASAPMTMPPASRPTMRLSMNAPTMAPPTKVASELTEKARAHLAKKDFALTGDQSSTGKPAYPIEDRAHARAALGLVGMHGSPEQKAEVRKDVARKYPDMLKASGVMAGVAKRLGAGPSLVKHFENNGHAYELAGLATLAAPVAADLKNDPEHRGHNAMELGGLGILAAPSAAALLGHH